MRQETEYRVVVGVVLSELVGKYIEYFFYPTHDISSTGRYVHSLTSFLFLIMRYRYLTL